MTFPPLPTDNLHKFVTYVGLFLIGYYFYSYEQYSKEMKTYGKILVEDSKQSKAISYLLEENIILSAYFFAPPKSRFDTLVALKKNYNNSHAALFAELLIDTSIAKVEGRLKLSIDKLNKHEHDGRFHNEQLLGDIIAFSKPEPPPYLYLATGCLLFILSFSGWKSSQKSLDNYLKLQNQKLEVEIEKMRYENKLSISKTSENITETDSSALDNKSEKSEDPKQTIHTENI